MSFPTTTLGYVDDNQANQKHSIPAEIRSVSLVKSRYDRVVPIVRTSGSVRVVSVVASAGAVWVVVVSGAIAVVVV